MLTTTGGRKNNGRFRSQRVGEGVIDGTAVEAAGGPAKGTTLV